MLKQVQKHLSNIIGWKTNRKIVVFESDDWGSIRMPSVDAYNRLKSKGVPVDTGDSKIYNSFDSLASPNDLDALFSTLIKFKDKNGVNPIITSMSLSANPDFEKIRNSGFTEYHFEPFTTTLLRYGFEKSFELWKQGLEQKLFIPQFHGREHLNVASWMRSLQRKDVFTLLAFDEGLWGFKSHGMSQINFQAAFDLEKPEDIVIQKEIICSGLEQFYNLHGFQALYFVPPNGPINNALLKDAADKGIKFVSAPKNQKEPLGDGKFKTHLHYIGQINSYDQCFLTRNCSFEPSKPGHDWVSSCLKEISIAFTWGKPAIISTHRVNFIGVHDESNRKNGINSLHQLLASMLKRWPDVEFMSSDSLGNLIRGNE